MALRPNERPGLKLSCLCPRQGLFTLTGKQRERRRQMDQRDNEPEQREGVGRRAVLGTGLGGLGAASLAALPGSAAGQTPTTPPPQGPTAPFPASRSGPLDRPYNVVLIVTDEEAYHLRA